MNRLGTGNTGENLKKPACHRLSIVEKLETRPSMKKTACFERERLGAITFDFSFTSLCFTVADLVVSSVLFMALINRTDVTIAATFDGVFDIGIISLTNSPSENLSLT